jgi:hypothetical protein
MAISETKLTPTDKFSIRNYATYRRDRPNAVNAGGVALLIHKDIPHQKINSPPGSTIETIGIKLISGTHIDTVRRRQTPNVPRLEQSWSTRANSEPTNQSRRTAGRKCWNAIGRPTKVDDRAPVRSPDPINMGHFTAFWSAEKARSLSGSNNIKL